MTTQINGDTGVSQCQPNSVSQDDLQSGVVGKGPAFAATAAANQVLNVGVWTKLAFNTETFDTNSNYAPASARFTPTVPGYYQVSCSAKIDEIGSGVGSYGANLSIDKPAAVSVAVGMAVGDDLYKTGFSASGLCYMNGTTDYLEAWVQTLGASGALAILGINFSASLVRAA